MAAHPVAPPDDCRSRLLSAAHAAFLEEGYRASVDRIVARAGVAKQTFYNHFPHKADLFKEVIRQSTSELLIALDDDGLSLRDRLIRFGIVYRDKALSATGLGLFRVLAAEAARFPDLAKTAYRTGPARTTARLAAVLQAAIDRGELCSADAGFAATILLSMLVGVERTRFLFSGEPPPRTNVLHAGLIVDCFLRAFAPEEPSLVAHRNVL